MSIKKEQQFNIRVIWGFFLLGGLLLLYKVADLQLMDATFREEASSATISKQWLQPSRGLMFDREGNLLVFNDPIYDIEVTVQQMDPDMDTTLLCELLEMSRSQLLEALDKDWHSPRYARHSPFTLLSKVSPQQYARFAEHQHKFPGFHAVMRNTRGYNTSHAAQVLGFISEVDNQRLQKQSGIYRRGDIMGKYGLEKAYEDQLRGSKGMRYVLKDKWGKNMGPFDQGRLDTTAVSGHDLHLTLDQELQAYAEQLLRGKMGSIVAIEPRTGEILCMASAPNYDPDLLALNRNRSQAFRALIRDSLQPFFNRAVSANYPAGSLLKPVYALAGQEMGVISPNEYYRCEGAYYYGKARWGCHAGPGTHNMVSAIQKSCNSYFYDIYRKMVDKYGSQKPKQGLAQLNEILSRMGLGAPLGIDIAGESPGLLPDAEFYDLMYSFQQAEWRSTYIVSNGIGQGEIQLTPLQMANLAALIANRGHYIPPHLVRSIESPTQGAQPLNRESKQSGLDAAYFPPVIEGMHRAVNFGTARQAYIPNIDVCGKTGTSQNPHGKDHSVFFAFAPKEQPQIAIAVFVENGGYGSTYAAPIAGLLVEKYLTDSISPGKQWIENRMLQAQLNPNL